MAPTMPARPPLQSPATNPNAFADLANSVHGLRANGKLGGQGSSEDLAFPFADHSGTIRRTPCYLLPVHFLCSYPCHTCSSARGRVCAFTPSGRSAQRYFSSSGLRRMVGLMPATLPTVFPFLR